MKYKLKNGGILKLQTAGSIPRVKVTIPEDNTPTQISTTSVKPPIRETTKEEGRKLAKEQTIREHEDVINYNKEHGTNFYNIDQVIEHEKSTTGLNMPITVPAMYGTATTPYINQQYIPTVQSTLKNELANGVAILTTPLMAGEFAAGIVPGLIKTGAGLGTSYAASKGLGAAGDWLDKKTNSNIYGPTGRFIGGIGGYVLGSGAAGSALRWAAGNGITAGIPQQTFNNLRGQYFARAYDRLPQPINNRFIDSTPALQGFRDFVGNKYIINQSTLTPPQEAATTYYFDPRAKLLSRPISEFERKGWTKAQRNSARGKITPSEYSGLSKGERNNGRYSGIRFIRHMGVVPELTEDGFVQIAPKRNFFANFTTDQIMVTHPDYPHRYPHTLIISPEAFRGNTPFSLDPGDTFFELEKLKIKPKHVTFISGDKTALDLARQRGFTVMSSPRLKLLYPWTQKSNQELAEILPAMKKRGFVDEYFGDPEWTRVKEAYDTEMDRVFNSRFNRPLLKDYVRLEEITGTPSHTYSWKMAPWDTFQGPKRGYQSVIYDTTPSTEAEILEKMGREMSHPTKNYMGFSEPFLFRVRNNLKPIKKHGGIIKV